MVRSHSHFLHPYPLFSPLECYVRFQRPLDRIFCSRPTSIGSSLSYAPVPDCAECILSEGPYSTLAGAAKLKINEKTTKADKLFLISQRCVCMCMCVCMYVYVCARAYVCAMYAVRMIHNPNRTLIPFPHIIINPLTLILSLTLTLTRPKTLAMSQVRKPAPNQAPPFHVDYESSNSPGHRSRPVWRHQLV